MGQLTNSKTSQFLFHDDFKRKQSKKELNSSYIPNMKGGKICGK